MFKRVTRIRKKKKGEKDETKKGAKDNKDSPKPGKSKKVEFASLNTYLYISLHIFQNILRNE